MEAEEFEFLTRHAALHRKASAAWNRYAQLKIKRDRAESRLRILQVELEQAHKDWTDIVNPSGGQP